MQLDQLAFELLAPSLEDRVTLSHALGLRHGVVDRYAQRLEQGPALLRRQRLGVVGGRHELAIQALVGRRQPLHDDFQADLLGQLLPQRRYVVEGLQCLATFGLAALARLRQLAGHLLELLQARIHQGRVGAEQHRAGV